jgi:Predicted metal binding domain
VAQFADPAVSTAKFDAEIAAFTAMRADYERRGWFLVDATFPTVFLVLAAPNLRPPAIVCGVLFDYSNYDAAPPSVRLVDPFTREPYRANELPTTLNRALPAQRLELPGMPDGGGLQMQAAQPLMQAHDAEDIPFFCIAGVREYHEHPGHTGDAWELHRAAGAGRLARLLEVIHRYGVEPITGYSVQLVPQVGFESAPPPP